MPVRPVEGDLQVASDILVEAARWLQDRGQPLWDPSELSPEHLQRQAAAGVLHLAHQVDEPVATIALQWEDRLFWPEAPSGESAFVHRLAVRRRVAGTGVAPALLAWAEERAREAGRRWLRLDCSATHPGLCRYYEARGFARHSRGSIGGFPFVRYQKRVGVDSPG